MYPIFAISADFKHLVSYRAHPNIKKILIGDIDFVKGYNMYQYLFDIQLCSILLAKCWKLSTIKKMTYFHLFLFFFFLHSNQENIILTHKIQFFLYIFNKSHAVHVATF